LPTDTKFKAVTSVVKHSLGQFALVASGPYLSFPILKTPLPAGISRDWYFIAVLTAYLSLCGIVLALSKKTREVVADTSGLSLDGVTFLKRATITSAACVPAKNGRYAVHVEGAWLSPNCTIYVDSQEEGGALLAALQLGAAHFRTLPPWRIFLRIVAICAGPLLFYKLKGLPAWGIGIAALLYGLLLGLSFFPNRVAVGDDGVFIRWLGGKRFIPFSDIQRVIANDPAIELVLRNGRRVQVSPPYPKLTNVPRNQVLLALISEGIAAHAGFTGADEEAFLARGGRDLETWMREMRALGASKASVYRAMVISRERLWAIVESPGVSPSAREGAALALSARLDESDRARLATLAQNTARPRLRVAFDGVSREHDATHLQIALEAAEEGSEEPALVGAPMLRAAVRRDDA
jgi:hypothetical protein